MSENAWSSCLLVFGFVVNNRWHVFAFEIILLCPLCSSFCSDFLGLQNVERASFHQFDLEVQELEEPGGIPEGSGKAFSVDLVPAE